ncbi:MAG: hypothetical protein FWE40_03610 [Oscillospiraceae bacterium]|nr:hypothetical protein [Oscillospiraceae bacterium]
MKKLLSIILACALLAIPFAITTMAAPDCCVDNDYDIICDGECCDECDYDVLGEANDDEGGFTYWWRRIVDTVMPYLTDLRNLATRITPIIAMVVAIINLVRMFT